MLLAPFTLCPLAPCSFQFFAPCSFLTLFHAHFSFFFTPCSFLIFFLAPGFFSCSMLLIRIFLCSMLLFVIFGAPCYGIIICLLPAPLPILWLAPSSFVSNIGLAPCSGITPNRGSMLQVNKLTNTFQNCVDGEWMS